MPPNKALQNDSDSLPPMCISEDTARFHYTYRGGPRSSVRITCVVSETVSLNHSNVRWFVFGDDDTVFIPENLVKTLSKYDHELWHYIGTNSKSLTQNKFFSFGGAGFAISYPLAGFWPVFLIHAWNGTLISMEVMVGFMLALLSLALA